MPKFKVYGHIYVTVGTVIEADSEEEAIEKAYEKLYVGNYVGNGGVDKLIGVDGTEDFIYADGEIEIDRAEELDEEDDE